MKKTKVLCVCEENAARSVMMAELLQDELGNGFEVRSAGVQVSSVGNSADSRATLCMKMRGIDISGHRGRWIGRLKLNSFSFIICTDGSTADSVFGLLGEANTRVFIADEGRGIPLSPDGSLLAYEACAELLDRVIPEIANFIRG